MKLRNDKLSKLWLKAEEKKGLFEMDQLKKFVGGKLKIKLQKEAKNIQMEI